MALADYFLPACTYAERNGLRIGDGAQRARDHQQGDRALGECEVRHADNPRHRQAHLARSLAVGNRGGPVLRHPGGARAFLRGDAGAGTRPTRRSTTACTRRACCARRQPRLPEPQPGASSCGAPCTTPWASTRSPQYEEPVPSLAPFPRPSSPGSTRSCSPRAPASGACPTGTRRQMPRVRARSPRTARLRQPGHGRAARREMSTRLGCGWRTSTDAASARYARPPS